MQWEGEVEQDKEEEEEEEEMVNCNCAEIFIFIPSHTTSKHNPGCCIEKENSKLGRVAALSPRPTIHEANCEVTVKIHHPQQ